MNRIPAYAEGRYQRSECQLNHGRTISTVTLKNRSGKVFFCEQPYDMYRWENEENTAWFCFWVSKKIKGEEFDHISLDDLKNKELLLVDKDQVEGIFTIEMIPDKRHFIKSGKLLLNFVRSI